MGGWFLIRWGMFIETVPNRNSPPAVLLRESYRDDTGRSQKRTLANLIKLSAEVVAGLKALLAGGTVVGKDGLKVERSLPHGHVAATLGTVRKLALDRLMLSTAKDADSRRHRDLVVGLIVDRLVTPRSKLGFVRAVNPETACTSLGEVLGLGTVAEREVYAALDWLVAQQPRIEAGLARRHLKDGTLVLYDVSSSYFEGRKCPLAQLGYSRDYRSDRPQIVYGLLCTRDGLPVAVEVFDGDTADPATLGQQILKLKARFKLDRVVLVGDRDMITNARRDYQEFRARRGGSTYQAMADCEALAEEDGELGLGHGPLARRHDPLLLGAVQDQEEEFCGGLVTGEMAPGPNRPAQLGIQRLNGIRRIQNPPDITGKSIERDDLGPGPPPTLADGRVFLAPVALLVIAHGVG